jgi:hypothetical protein
LSPTLRGKRLWPEEKSHPGEEEIEAILAPEIPDAEGGTENDEPRQASLPDLLVTKAKQTGAAITFINVYRSSGVARIDRRRRRLPANGAHLNQLPKLVCRKIPRLIAS